MSDSEREFYALRELAQILLQPGDQLLSVVVVSRRPPGFLLERKFVIEGLTVPPLECPGVGTDGSECPPVGSDAGRTLRLTRTMLDVMAVLDAAARPMKSEAIARAMGRAQCNGSLREVIHQLEVAGLIGRPDGRGGGYWSADRPPPGRPAGEAGQ
jgi:hypothetical protein